MKLLYFAVAVIIVMAVVVLKFSILKEGAITERVALPPAEVEKPLKKELPGYRVYGDYDIQAYDKSLPLLYGPFYTGQISFFKLRVLTKRTWQPVNDATFRYDLYPPEEIKNHFEPGQYGSSECQVKVESGGIYHIGCRFDEAGEWGVQLRFENLATKENPNQEKIATMMFKVLVKNSK